MKKYLPTSTSLSVNTSKGFTLVELMVVIAIIAVLSVIAFALFNNVQKAARDAIRREEITAISKAMEINYDNSTAKYVVLSGVSFGAGTVPEDIYKGLAKCGTGGTKWCDYCGRTTAGTAMTKGENLTTGCPAGGSRVTTSAPAADTAFEVCATLEMSPYFYCKTNSR